VGFWLLRTRSAHAGTPRGLSANDKDGITDYISAHITQPFPASLCATDGHVIRAPDCGVSITEQIVYWVQRGRGAA
jgi:hypothetical protein